MAFGSHFYEYIPCCMKYVAGESMYLETSTNRKVSHVFNCQCRDVPLASKKKKNLYLPSALSGSAL